AAAGGRAGPRGRHVSPDRAAAVHGARARVSARHQRLLVTAEAAARRRAYGRGAGSFMKGRATIAPRATAGVCKQRVIDGTRTTRRMDRRPQGAIGSSVEVSLTTARSESGSRKWTASSRI